MRALSTSAIRAAAARTTEHAQFNVKSVTGPTFGSLGMESGRNLLRGRFDNRVDAAISRDIRMGGNRALEFRLDVFNVFNTVIITNRQNQISTTARPI